MESALFGTAPDVTISREPLWSLQGSLISYGFWFIANMSYVVRRVKIALNCNIFVWLQATMVGLHCASSSHLVKTKQISTQVALLKFSDDRRGIVTTVLKREPFGSLRAKVFIHESKVALERN